MAARSRLAAILLSVGASSSGCAYLQHVRLDGTAPREDVLARVVIEDARAADEKETHIVAGDGKCARTYGDAFIEPSKIDYLRSLLAERLAPSSQLVIKLERFDTIEYCGLSLSRAQRDAEAGAIAGVTSGVISISTRAVSGRDAFELQLAGAANGVRFDFRRGFDYSDIHFVNFPSDSADYRHRIERLFGEFAAHLRKTLASSTQVPRRRQGSGARGGAVPETP